MVLCDAVVTLFRTLLYYVALCGSMWHYVTLFLLSNVTLLYYVVPCGHLLHSLALCGTFVISVTFYDTAVTLCSVL
jgi:hypothetical protein